MTASNVEKPEGRGRYRLVPSDPQPATYGPEALPIPAGYVHMMLVPDDWEATAQEVQP